MEPAASATTNAGSGAPLDEVMLAMDVVDTLRHREQWVAEELAAGDRDAALLEQLRRTYAAQGIEVPERVLLDGVAALREDRFAYRPAPPSVARTWATVYVTRGRWGRWLAMALVVAALVAVGYQQSVVAPRTELRAELDATAARIATVAKVDEAVPLATRSVERGRTALDAGDLGEARQARDDLRELLATLERAFELRIVVGENLASGVWRVPEGNPAARNHYLIVEAIDAGGRALTLPILNEETGRVERVASWGLRVDEATWSAVAADKADDGIISRRTVGRKHPGELEPRYDVTTTGGTITRW